MSESVHVLVQFVLDASSKFPYATKPQIMITQLPYMTVYIHSKSMPLVMYVLAGEKDATHVGCSSKYTMEMYKKQNK